MFQPSIAENPPVLRRDVLSLRVALCQIGGWIENSTGQVAFASLPAAAGLPVGTSDLANKGYVDSRLTAVLDELVALKAEVAALMGSS